MNKLIKRYVCQECGAQHPRWSGRCDSCNSWNTIIEEIQRSSKSRQANKSSSLRASVQIPEVLSTPIETTQRIATAIEELDRVLGGGLVSGSVILLGGDPGIGKSTLLLQVASKLNTQLKCFYVTGEEALDQIRLRAQRLHVENSEVYLLAVTNVSDIIQILEKQKTPSLLIVDSIQTVYNDLLDAAPGTVSQVRSSAHELIRFAKVSNTILILVGHVTKEGTVAGPRVLEHMVDTVLYFEGERANQFRILRSVKNRFGPTSEIGVFQMAQTGLSEVTNPSKMLLAGRSHDAIGSCIFAGIEGSRPMLAEIQALIAPSPFGTPRRSVIGLDGNRLAMILAVLEARCNISLSNRDIFLNVVGGLKISDPAADLAVAAALLSSLFNFPSPQESIIFGEIGLSAEIRTVNYSDIRLKEGFKLGFTKAIISPIRSINLKLFEELEMNIKEVSSLHDLVTIFKNSNTRFDALT